MTVLKPPPIIIQLSPESIFKALPDPPIILAPSTGKEEDTELIDCILWLLPPIITALLYGVPLLKIDEPEETRIPPFGTIDEPEITLSLPVLI